MELFTLEAVWRFLYLLLQILDGVLVVAVAIACAVFLIVDEPVIPDMARLWTVKVAVFVRQLRKAIE